MKKIITFLTVTCFFAVNVSLAQTAAPKAAEKEKTEVKAEAKASTPSCCVKANKACCKSEAAASKKCTPEQKAACAKEGAKAEASEKKETKSGTN